MLFSGSAAIKVTKKLPTLQILLSIANKTRRKCARLNKYPTHRFKYVYYMKIYILNRYFFFFFAEHLNRDISKFPIERENYLKTIQNCVSKSNEM